MFVVNAPQELLLLDNKVGTLSRGEFGRRVERFDGEGTGMFKGGQSWEKTGWEEAA